MARETAVRGAIAGRPDHHPKAIRERLRVEPGDRIDFVVQADGTVRVEPAVQGATPLKGLLAMKGRRKVSVAAMHAAISRRAAGR